MPVIAEECTDVRRRSLIAGRSHGFEPFMHQAELLNRVRADWRALRPLVAWVADHRAEP